MMTAIDVAQHYAAAFNAHDVPGVVSVFASGGTYTDPVVAHGVDRHGLVEYVSGLLTAIPDLQFELVTLAPAGKDMVVLEWVMRGTNTGPLPQGPATHRTIALPGVDVIKIEDGRIVSLNAYFDRMTYAEQLGLVPPNGQVD
jgi:steroid delta-isomerase-like uncharacterized protein